MANSSYYFTSESVCSGHPDKICDQISDAIVDEVLKKDRYGRVAVETLVTYDRVVMAGEVSAKANVNFEKIARKQIKKLGYTNGLLNFSYKSPIGVYIHTQSPEIAKGVKMKGAGDQGMMFGFACRETKEYMPLPITLAHKLAMRLDAVREKKILPHLLPDGKTQVTIEYKNGKPYRVVSVILAAPHKESVSLSEVKHDLFKKVVGPTLKNFGFKIKAKDLIVNGTGVWHLSGPAADTGVTGRKIIVDTYGGYAKVGGGCFSGKDPTKVDRSGAYAARYIAKNIVAHGLADKVEVGLAYFIGAKRPIMQEIETFGTNRLTKKAIRDFSVRLLDTSVEGILQGLNLRRPIYLSTAVYGHFGREGFPWEKVS
ncbi:methionine adenosyltransferase [Candidatus Roizmanbacteria bacterium]|nr:methionine adenosyltransferase [Candidatus Roizmanbacteria bacterium]